MFKSLYYKQRKGGLDSLYNTNSICSSLLSSPIKVLVYSKGLTKVVDGNFFTYNCANRVPYNQLGFKKVDKQLEKPVRIILVLEYPLTPSKNSN